MRINLGPEAVARSRFAISPLWELIYAIRLLAGRSSSSEPTLEPWLRSRLIRYQSLRARIDLDPLLALQPSTYGADFLSPPPTSDTSTIGELLETVRVTPLAVARREIQRALRDQTTVMERTRRFLARQDVCDGLADLLGVAWDVLLAPDWPAIRALLERDVQHRAARLASGGWAAALADLHPHLRWRGARIESDQRPGEVAALGGGGVLFIPSVFVWPHHVFSQELPWPPVLIYSARGVAAPAHSSGLSGGDALAKLLGASRSALLLALDQPTSTTQLAARLGQSLGAVGDHLAVLRAAGLVVGVRFGRSVLYRRTPAADAVLAAATPTHSSTDRQTKS